ncbi:MAG: hypothetical protein WCS96_06285 [Victivallales bacterium]
MKKKKKKQQDSKLDHDIERLNPLIVINEPDECLFAIVDFSITGNNHVRRVISKRLKSGNISAVMYEGEIGPDKTCNRKLNIMEMKEAPPEQFWKAVNTLSLLYQAVGGVSDIRLYDGKTLKEAAEMMRRFDHAKVWMTPCDGK